jgi:hypothetical protein
MSSFSEWIQVLLDHVASGRLGARDFLMGVSAAGLSSGLSAATVQQALTAGEAQTLNQAKAKRAYDYIVIGSGASGSVIAGELSKTGADVLVVESGGEDAGTTISNPSIWFYNVGGPLDWTLPIAPVPQLNNRQFNMRSGVSSVAAAPSTRWCGRAVRSEITTAGNAMAPQAGPSRTCCSRAPSLVGSYAATCRNRNYSGSI